MADMQMGVRLDDSEAAEIVSFLHSLTREVPVNDLPPLNSTASRYRYRGWPARGHERPAHGRQ
jgi:hypothetical protein